MRRRFQHFNTPALDFFIQTGGKRFVAIMKQKLVIRISR
jgi:hypothetical protein